MINMRAFLFSASEASAFTLSRRIFSLRASLLSVTLTVAGWAAAATAGRAAELKFTSNPERVALIELFSSEGCSSCPPAEHWLGELRTAPGLWRDFVPVAFHVDYWNRLGWTDRFSTREFTQRQYAIAQHWGSGSVYTPCFVRNGAEWHPQNVRTAGTEIPGVLSVTVIDKKTCRVAFSSAAPASMLEVHVALLGGGFVSKVTGGENRGETLPQEFVALALADHPLIAEGLIHRAEFSLPRPLITEAARHAIAVWVTRRSEPIPLQATGGWLE
jgi:hypothetical protein